MRVSQIKYIVASLLLLLFSAAQASTATKVTAAQNKYQLQNSLEYLSDFEGRYTIDNITKVDTRVWQETNGVNFGFVDNPYWFKTTLVTGALAHTSFLLEIQYAILDKIDLYLIENGQVIQAYQAGDRLPFNDRVVKHREFLFPLVLKSDTEYQIYIRVRTTSSLQFMLNLEDEISFIEKDQTLTIFLGLFYGVIISMMIYNGMLGFVLRDQVYIFYVLYVLFLFLFQSSLHGIMFQYVWPDQLYWHEITINLFAALSATFFCKMTILLLDLKEKSKMTADMFHFLMACSLFSAILGLFMPYNIMIKFSMTCIFIICTLTLYTGIRQSLAGNKPAYLYSSAFACLLVGVVVMILNKSGVLPSNMYTDHGIMIGATIEVFLLGFSIAYRVRLLREEKIMTKLSLVELERQAANDKLESETKYNETMRDLVAGVAHEINTPLGICITAVTYSRDSLQAFRDKILEKKCSLADCNRFAILANDANELLESNLKRINYLSSSFKKVAVDLSSETPSDFYLKPHIEGAKSLLLELNHDILNKHKIIVEIDEDLEINNYEIAISQIFASLIENSICHGFSEMEQGTIKIHGECKDGVVKVNYQDNGRGMSKEEHQRVFDPFYTTARQRSMVGLGMHVVKNIINIRLKGSIFVHHEDKKGFRCTIIFPANLE